MAAVMDSTSTSMPGSYFLQYDHDRNRNNGGSHSIFKPPAPSPTPSRISQIPRPTSRSSTSRSSRKRPKLDTNTSYFARPSRPSLSHQSSTTTTTPFTLDGSYDNVSFRNLDSSTYSLEDSIASSPLPLANSEYRLAGGLDTPSQSFERSLEELAQDEAEKDHRFNRYTTSNTSVATLSRDGSGGLRIPSSGSEFGSHGKKRLRSTPPSMSNSTYQSNWGIRSTAWALTGGLAGRVFTFCINTAFRGFRAGGGHSYSLDGSTASLDSQGFDVGSSGVGNSLDEFSSDRDLGGFVEDYMNSPDARKRQRPNYTPTASSSQWSVSNHERSAIKSDWQIIDSANFDDSEADRSPARKKSRASTAGGWQNSKTVSGRATPSGASYASPRGKGSLDTGTSTAFHNHARAASSGTNIFQPLRRSRPSFAPSHARRSTSQFATSTSTTTNGHLLRSPERPSSASSMRNSNRASTPTNSKAISDLSPEVMNYQRKVRTQERLQDENLRRLNAQLRDMIREGREALGSTVEIVDERGLDGYGNGSRYEDEGFYDDGWK